MKDGLHELEKDGLINKGEKVNIEFKDDILSLNGKPQSKEISEKYKKYFSKAKTTLHIDADDKDEVVK